MLRADQLPDMIEVIEDVLDRGRLVALTNMRTPVMPITPPRLRHGLDGFVGLAAWVALHERAAVGMGDQHGLGR